MPLRGARISQVTSLKNANRCLENQVYDLIVCSYELRDGDSLSLFEAARAQDMAIIVASGNAGRGDEYETPRLPAPESLRSRLR